MILKLKYEDLTGNAARGEVNGKNVNFYMRVQVDEMNIVEAIEKLRGNRYVVALDYVGELSFLNTIDTSGVNIIVTREVKTLDDSLDFLFSEVKPNIRVALKLPDDFKDMRAIHAYSQRYPNARFCGGKLIRLEGCNVGCIAREDISKKIPNSRISVVTEGCGCVLRNIHIDDVDVIEFYEVKSKAVKKKLESASKGRAKSSKPKRKIPSFIPVNEIGSMDNF